VNRRKKKRGTYRGGGGVTVLQKKSVRKPHAWHVARKNLGKKGRQNLLLSLPGRENFKKVKKSTAPRSQVEKPRRKEGRPMGEGQRQQDLGLHRELLKKKTKGTSRIETLIGHLKGGEKRHSRRRRDPANYAARGDWGNKWKTRREGRVGGPPSMPVRRRVLWGNPLLEKTTTLMDIVLLLGRKRPRDSILYK